MKTKLDKELLNSTSRNSSNWKNVFYKNNKDYRLIVPKLNPSLGWTLNFSSPYSYIFLIAIILIAIIFSVFVH